MKKIITSFSILIFGVSILFGQNEIRTFKDVKFYENQKEISFYLVGINDIQQRKNIQILMNADENINYVNIYPDNKCHLKINSSIDADYIYNLIKPQAVDFDYSFVDKKTADNQTNYNFPQVIENSKELPSDFPKRINTGDEKEDERILYEKVQIWKANNPDRWQEMLDNRYK